MGSFVFDDFSGCSFADGDWSVNSISMDLLGCLIVGGDFSDVLLTISSVRMLLLCLTVVCKCFSATG